ncbi:hypothetical protein L1987_35291 [Smallanthus sonchifolius]|uniref:Uncharacterized protein n=1 Tax=Smallanthus sonchifolius TaxID=185202 RepID=A0ACB9HXY9_9ASTR|nr:hypothetical protein L1987_35291 [Smallanthus sonchifolius]
MRRGRSKSPIAFVVVIVSVSCFFVLILTFFRLPDVSFSNGSRTSINFKKISKITENSDSIGKFGEMMIEMLPHDLSFTIFVPSETAFESDLRLRVSESLAGEKANDTYAILTRVLSFTVVPWKILSESVSYTEEITCDSLSGLKLQVSKDADDMLVVNRVRSSRVNLRKGEVVIHVMNGVIMEAEFEQSVRSDDSDEDED